MADEPTRRPVAPAAASLRYVDRPECNEIFVDSMVGSVFDVKTLRLEFAATRLDDVKQNFPVTGRRYTACRLALSPSAAIELMNRMQQIAAAMAQAGLLKPPERWALQKAAGLCRHSRAHHGWPRLGDPRGWPRIARQHASRASAPSGLQAAPEPCPVTAAGSDRPRRRGARPQGAAQPLERHPHLFAARPHRERALQIGDRLVAQSDPFMGLRAAQQ